MYEETINTIEAKKCIVILRGIDTQDLAETIEALYEGGIRLVEITFDQTGRVSDTETARNIAWAVGRYAGRMTIGGGTVLTKAQLTLLCDAGGAFAISPHTEESLIAEARTAGLVSIPGAMSVTEIEKAYHAGADYVKVFPAGALGPSFFHALQGPLPHRKLLAVGGITPADVPAYRASGAFGFAVGSAVANGAWASGHAYERIRASAAAFAALCE